MPLGIRMPSPAMVVALLALFTSLGGVGYAAATGSIDSREIKNNSIRGKDVRNGTITGKDIGTGRIGSSDVKNNGLTGSDISEPSLGKVNAAARADSSGSADSARSIAANTVDSGRVVNGSLTGDDVGRASGTAVVDPAVIAANSCLEVVATVQAGVDIRDDAVVVTMESTFPPNLSVTPENSTTPGLLRLNVCNASNVAINPATQSFHWVAFDVD